MRVADEHEGKGFELLTDRMFHKHQQLLQNSSMTMDLAMLSNSFVEFLQYGLTRCHFDHCTILFQSNYNKHRPTNHSHQQILKHKTLKKSKILNFIKKTKKVLKEAFLFALIVNSLACFIVNICMIFVCYNLSMQFKILLILTLFTAAFCDSFQIYGPECATSSAQPIPYSLSNFGTIPYGQTIIGQVILPSQPELCKLEGQSILSKTNPQVKSILLVKRGTCKFVEKVINAQKLGADMVIIYDNEGADSIQVIMKNDGHGHLAEIPSLFISRTHGEGLATVKQDCKLPVLKIQFSIEKREKADVTFWLDASNRETYILARDFYKNNYYKVLQQHMDFNVRFRIETTCRSMTFCDKEDCIGTLLNSYCRNVPLPSKDSQVKVTRGADIIKQQLRQFFLWQEMKAQSSGIVWWQYMKQFDHQVCIQRSDIGDCSKQIMKSVGVTQQTIEKVNKMIDETIQNATKLIPSENILKEDALQAKQMGIYFYPQATINNRNFYGLFKAPQVFEMICDSLLSPPKQCRSKTTNETVIGQEDSHKWKTILIILVVMTIGFLLALCIYTRLIRREIDQQLSVEVNKMVENYVNMTEKSSSNVGNTYSKMDN